MSACPGRHRRGAEPPALRPGELLCHGCVQRVRSALAGLPELFVWLRLALEPGTIPAQRGPSGKRTPRAFAPLPLDPRGDELCQRLADCVCSWAEVVGDAVGLTPHPGPGRAVAGGGSTQARAVDRACARLRAHLGALVALPSTTVTRTRNPSEIAALPDDAIGHMLTSGEARVLLDMDGVQACAEILDVEKQARSLLGQTQGLDRLPGVACPNPACGALALFRWHGADFVECGECAERWPEADYQRLVLILADDARRQLEFGG